MNVIPMNNPVYVDVDGTIVRNLTYDEKQGLAILDFCPNSMEIPHPLRGNKNTVRVPMKANVELLRDMHARGRTIVVWSANGYQWAEAVCKALELDKLSPPIIVIEKPICYIDDLDAAQFMGHRIFLND
jgi:hypothetical protein